MPQGSKLYPSEQHTQQTRCGTGLQAALYRLDKTMWRVFDELAAVVFIGMIVVTIFAVIVREWLEWPVPWINDLARFLFIWSVYLGFAVLSRRNEHIAVDVFYSYAPRPVQRAIDALVALTGAVLSGYSAYFGWQITYRALVQGQRSLSAYLPAWVGYAAVPIGLALGALGYLCLLLLRTEEPGEKIAVETREIGDHRTVVDPS